MEAYPLQYPVGYPRTKRPRRSAFSVSLAAARDALMGELHLLGAKSIVVSSNATIRGDGLPYAKQPKIDDCGVAVYFIYQGQQMVFACDKWDDVASNIRAIGLTVSAIRGMERWGVSEMLNRAFAGFKALPENATVAGWFDGLSGAAEIKARYRELVKKYHPNGGSSPNSEVFVEIQRQYEAAQKRFEQ